MTPYNFLTQASYRPQASGHIAVSGPVSMEETQAGDVPSKLEHIAAVIRENKIADKDICRVGIRNSEVDVSPECGRRLGIGTTNDMSGSVVISGVTFTWNDIPF